MTVDLKHNKIVRDTMTERFSESVYENLVPIIEDKYGSDAVSIQMYEDYISDAFTKGGAWYYPLTVLTADGAVTEWIKWDVDKSSFKDSVPYAYVGDSLVKFKLAEPPIEFVNKMEGRAIYAERGGIGVRVDAAVPNVTVLSGKYSQSFVDEMARQLTAAICSAMSLATLDGSSLELSLVFAPETYMEHISENVTYRRLLMSDKGSAPRDFWIKWTRLDGVTAYSVADHVSADNILFEIGEDVSQKIREKEYRHLIRLGKDKYHNAMGRKNVTEWRELIKRAIRRGELMRVDDVVENKEQDAELAQRLAEVLGTTSPAPAKVEPIALTDDEEFAMALKRLAEQTLVSDEPAEDETPAEPEAEEVLEVEQTSDNFVFSGVDTAQESVSEDDDAVFVSDGQGIDLASLLDELDELDSDESDVAEDEAEDESDDEVADSELTDEEMLEEYLADDEETLADVRALELDEDEETDAPEAPEAVAPTAEPDAQAKMRAELEAQIRLEYESRARMKAEEEAERLRREQELLRIENEKLQEQMARERREQELREEELRAEEARLRAQIELQLRAETRERERLAEAARIAVEEQRRLEAEHAKITKERDDEIRKNEEERREAESAKRAEQARVAEVERIRREKMAKAAKADEAPTEDTKYTYVSKVVRLVFRRSVDPNITARIYEIIKLTLEYYGKDKIYLKVKASVPNSETVCLEFIKIPMEEMQLLSNIIKVLGNSGLGIAKAIVE